MKVYLKMNGFDRFLTARGYTPRTRQSYHDLATAVLRAMALRLRIPAHRLTLADLTRARLQSYVDRSMETVAPSTIHRRVAALRCFYRYLICRDATTVNVANLLLCPRFRRQRGPLLRHADAMAILEAPLKAPLKAGDTKLQRLRDASLLVILYEGGLRCSEGVSLNIGSLHFDAPKSGLCLLQFVGKGTKPRTVVVKRSAKRLREYLAERAAEGHLLLPSTPLFFGLRKARGGRIARTTVASIVAKWAVAAGVAQHVHPHMFRAACATHMWWGGAEKRSIQDHLGHEGLQMTEWYCHSNPNIAPGVGCHPLNQKRGAGDPRKVLKTAMSQLAELERKLDQAA